MKKILEVKNISKKYQNKESEVLALKDVNLEVEEGEFVSIIGPSRMWKVNTFIIDCRIRRKK